MIKKMLFDCSVTLLKILIKQYESGILSYNDLIVNTKLKKEFIEDHLSEIESVEDKKTAEILIEKLESISINTCSNTGFSKENSDSSVLM